MELYSDPHVVAELLLQAQEVPEELTTLLLNQFTSLRFSSASVRTIHVNPDSIIEDGIKALFKGDFCATSKVQISLRGKPTCDLGGVL